MPVVPPPFADTTTAYSISTAVCAALFHRAKTGKGQKIETSLLSNALMISMNHFAAVPAADAEARARFAAVLEDAQANGAGLDHEHDVARLALTEEHVSRLERTPEAGEERIGHFRPSLQRHRICGQKRENGAAAPDAG